VAGVLEGKVAIVTGGGSGIGKAAALTLAREGARVVIADIDLSSAQVVATEIESMGRQARAIKCDVPSSQETSEMAQETLEAFGGIDILVNNAGIIEFIPTHEMDKADWDRIIGINLNGVFLCAQAVGRQMIKQKSGKIVNIASIAAHQGLPGVVAYCASKGGILALTRSLAVEWAQYNINVNSVSPGRTVTGLTVGAGLDTEKIRQRIPLDRINKPDDVADTILFLASSASDNITGQDIIVDGGVAALYWPQ
jgi:NAD(P)-dependent dehydrogenase (short-subunit alcohol dehydrogenase family)